MTDVENPVKEGFLWFPPHGVLGQLKKTWQKKYCQLFKSSKHGVDRLEVFENEDEVGRTSSNLIITLENCIKIAQDAQKHQPHVFALITKSTSYYFATNLEEEMNEWIAAFQTVAFRDNISRQTIEEDNDLYCSSNDAGVFAVKLVTSDASTRCGLTAGPYTLLATPTALQLLDPDDRHALYTWPYLYIRRYGYRGGKFTFEAGRKCETGEGVFHFAHSKEIFNAIAAKMRSMKTMLNADMSSAGLLCGDSQLHAALAMVARSRSPLPPSPNAEASDLSYSMKQLCQNSLEQFFSSSNCSFANSSGSQSVSQQPLLTPPTVQALLPPLPPPPKPKQPADPLMKLSEKPKKPLPLEDSDDSLVESDTSTNSQLPYDDVEVRNEAWRTMGVNIVDQQMVTPALKDKVVADKIFRMQSNSTSASDYDRLQHIGPTVKQAASPGYQMLPCTRIEEPIFACRRSDDFKGYGQIRKKSVDVTPKHLLEGGYAIICKAERV